LYRSNALKNTNRSKKSTRKKVKIEVLDDFNELDEIDLNDAEVLLDSDVEFEFNKPPKEVKNSET